MTNNRFVRTVQVTERNADGRLIQVNKKLERMLVRQANINKSGRVSLFAGIIKGKIQ